jgi:hypothetical protein
MKKCIFLLVLVILPCVAQAAEMSTSIASGSQYRPGRNYGFQVVCQEMESIDNATLEWNGNSYTASGSSYTFYYNISNLPAGGYSYNWIVKNLTDTLTFPNTYAIAKNSSVNISLTLDGTSGNKSYKKNTIANFIATLPLAGKTIKLESNYPGFVTQTNTTSIRYSQNLSSYGLFYLTASWSGDENYTESFRTHYFDSGPPQIAGVKSTPSGAVGYMPNVEYVFQMNCVDSTLTSVWFESNYTGTMKSYYSNSNPQLQNSSGTFSINLGNLGVRNFSYRWHAKDNLNEESVTEYYNYQILKMNPLVLELLPSSNVKEGTEVTANCFSINPLEVNVSKFVFFKDSVPVKNISSSTRMDVFLMTAGVHDFTCYTNGTGNYTNQSITKMITVTAGPVKEVESEGIVEVRSVNFPVVDAGQSAEASFEISNGLFKNIENITVNMSHIPGDWVIIEMPAHLFRGETKIVKMSVSIPSDAEGKSYAISINVKADALDGRKIDINKGSSMTVIARQINEPPRFASSNVQKNGNEVEFSLETIDDKGVSGYIFSSNITGVWQNDSWASLDGSEGTLSIVKNVSSSSTVAWKIYANDSNNAWSESQEYISSSVAAPSDMSLVLISAVIIVIVLAAAILLIIKKRPREPEFIYSKEDLNEEG